MPRKKAEPEVLQEETVQPEITDIEELTPAEQPALEPQIEEPVQPYGEGESSAAEDSDFKTGDTVMVVIQRYDDGKKQIFGKIVGR